MTFWKRFRHDWHIRLYMLLLAILLWLVVVMTQEYETTINVPVVHMNTRPDKILVSDIPSSVPVRFSGKGKDLMMLMFFRPARLELDLQAVDRDYAYPLHTELVEVPAGISAVPLVLPGQDTIRVVLEDRITRTLPVRPQVEIRTRPGYVLSDSLRVTPDSVRVSGPETVVSRIERMQTQERVFVGLAGSIEETVPLVAGKRVQLTPPEVRIQIEVDRLGERTIKRVPIEVRGSTRGRTVILEPSVVDVHVKGPASRLAYLTADSLSVRFTLNRWNRNQREYTPDVTLPDGVEFIDLTPEQVLVRLEVD
ncbi:MAG: hypothetical protein MAG453_02160 [Calditrichaeota bacterium]|nr:hypothetical protein [Calditrichota bacterium]